MPQYIGTGTQITHDDGLAAYLDAACWASHDDEHGELYAHMLSEQAIKIMSEDWQSFYAANRDDIGERVADAACDFWLTRNRHGSGFWDTGRWEPDAGKRLTDMAHAHGEAYLYVGDDGLIYHGLDIPRP